VPLPQSSAPSRVCQLAIHSGSPHALRRATQDYNCVHGAGNQIPGAESRVLVRLNLNQDREDRGCLPREVLATPKEGL
jgi:hypothetical protein